jgi:16S rRNA (guanine966-N2)-methyltransferase
VRIIAGEFRGRVLIEPRFDTTRPITDRVKQSLFDVLTPLIDNNTVAYDCFCGTGSMGLECLSRGAKQAVFFDADRTALDGLRKNISSLRVADRAKIIAGDIFRNVSSILPAQKATLLFFDPPYAFLTDKPGLLRQAVSQLVQHHLTHDATIIFRHDSKDTLGFDDLIQHDLRTYGSMTVELLKPAL